MGRIRKPYLTVAEQLAEIRELRRLLVEERSNLAAKNRSLAADNMQLKVEKTSLIKYIKELEMYLPHKRNENDEDEKMGI